MTGVARVAASEGARPTEADVRACYRYILGREAESEEVVRRHLAHATTLQQLRAAFLRSPEFRARHPDVLPLPAAMERSPIDVEVEAAPDDLAAMLERIAAYWGAIGVEAPHWSVLTQSRYLPGEIERHKGEFYASGQGDARLICSLLAQHGIPAGGVARVVEFGCGVGRVTLALARLFPEVTGCDVSDAHLGIARAEAEARQLGNIAWHRSTIAAPMPDTPCDLWFSRIVLQHNPPPIMAWLLRRAFRSLAPGGVAIFQVPTHARGYRFTVAADLAARQGLTMEMHALPQRAVFSLAAEAGLELLEVRDDPVVGDPTVYASHIFVLRRPGA